MLTYGSLFAGYSGLDMGVQSVIGGRTAWVSENEPGPSRILAHHYPDAPNLGDMTRINWSSVDPVDILTGGFPCQDVSHAGRRAGMIRDGDGKTRSGLWGDMRQAIDTLRPSLVVVENVRGLLSATVDSDVEPCPWCLGDGGGEPHLRALGAVLADLADVGYDAWWTGLRASGVGAPHGRFRVFIFATPKDADRTTRGEWRAPASREETQGGARSDAGRRSGTPSPDPKSIGWDEGRAEPAGIGGRLHAPFGGAPLAADTESDGLTWSRNSRTGRNGSENVSDTASDADSGRCGVVGRVESEFRHTHGRDREDGHGARPEPEKWGAYAAAVARWERVLGAPAPDPTEPGANGNRRLAAPFAEWMMGLPAGWVTSPEIGLTRNEQLKAIGNGVVPQQAAAATRWWLEQVR